MPAEDFKEVEDGEQKESEEDERPGALEREEDAVEEQDAKSLQRLNIIQ